MAYGQQEEGAASWRARYKRPDGTWGSRSGFSSEKAAEEWGAEQEALIRRNLWLDPRDGETRFEIFAEEALDAVSPRLEGNTVAKYRSLLDNHLLPQWGGWSLVGIFNGYVEIETWVSELHEDYAESTVATIFAAFSTFMTAAVRARKIPANPCHGVRVTSGEYEFEKLVASPVQILRAAMRLYQRDLGLSGFTLCLMDAFTGARWGELAGQQRHEYEEESRAIVIKEPLKEVRGVLTKGARSADAPPEVSPAAPAPRRGKKGRRGRTKTPAGTRTVELPPSIAVFYEELMDSHRHPFVFCTPTGGPWRRTNFRARHWRPVWDGADVDDPSSPKHVPEILPTFTFHEGRHTHATWLVEDGVPEVARRARLGQKMKGMARVYDHVTPVMRQQILDVLEARWIGSLAALTPAEQATLVGWFPHLGPVLPQRTIEPARDLIAISSPSDE